MHAFNNERPASTSPEPDLLLEWTVDIDRISRLAREAFRTDIPDPWTRIEAECVIQLVDAELLAMASRQGRGEPVEATIRHLKRLRTETVLALKTLEVVERHKEPKSTLEQTAFPVEEIFAEAPRPPAASTAGSQFSNPNI